MLLKTGLERSEAQITCRERSSSPTTKIILRNSATISQHEFHLGTKILTQHCVKRADENRDRSEVIQPVRPQFVQKVQSKWRGVPVTCGKTKWRKATFSFLPCHFRSCMSVAAFTFRIHGDAKHLAPRTYGSRLLRFISSPCHGNPKFIACNAGIFASIVRHHPPQYSDSISCQRHADTQPSDSVSFQHATLGFSLLPAPCRHATLGINILPATEERVTFRFRCFPIASHDPSTSPKEETAPARKI